MSVNTEVLVDDVAVVALMSRLAEVLSPYHMAGFLATEINPYLQERTQRRFETEGDELSGAWAALSQATVEIRESSGYPGEHPINVRTGQLERFMTDGSPNTMAAGYGAMLRYPGGEASGELRTKVETAQSGREEYPVTPARPVIGLDETDLAFVMSTLALDLAMGIRA